MDLFLTVGTEDGAPESTELHQRRRSRSHSTRIPSQPQNIYTDPMTLPSPDLAHSKEKGKGAPHSLLFPGQKSTHANTQPRGVKDKLNRRKYVLRIMSFSP
jgi:hypothetical protein